MVNFLILKFCGIVFTTLQENVVLNFILEYVGMNKRRHCALNFEIEEETT